MVGEIKNKILIGNYERAQVLIDDAKEEIDLYKLLTRLAWETQSLASYGMTVYLLSLDENAYLHNIATDILAFALCHIEGAYSLALFHARKALELDPVNIEYKQFLLFFFDIPERLISREEALKIAKEVLEKNPTHKISQEIVKSLS